MLYVSRSRIVYSENEKRVDEIVEFSRGWNAAVGITGALAFTELNFVQFIEGPLDAIDDMLTKIKADRRHTDVTVIEDTFSTKRQFEHWSLAYSGPDTFIDRELVPALMSQTDVGQTAKTLRALLQSMADHA